MAYGQQSDQQQSDQQQSDRQQSDQQQSDQQHHDKDEPMSHAWTRDAVQVSRQCVALAKCAGYIMSCIRSSSHQCCISAAGTPSALTSSVTLVYDVASSGQYA